MKVNGKSKTPITAAQSKKKNGEEGGTKARASQQTSKKKHNGVKTAVLERISDGILAFDAGMNYTYLNERAGELLGRSAADLIGKNLLEEYAEADPTPFMEACQRALETQSVVWLNEYFPPTGRWLEGRVYPSGDGVSVLFAEGAGQKTTEVEDRYRLLVESMQEAFFQAEVLIDEQGQPQDYRLLDVNAAMERLLGRHRRQIVGQTIRELLPLTGRDLELVKRIAAVGLGGEPFFIDEYSESMQRWFRSHFFSPQPGQVSGMSIDITESKRVEGTLQAIVNQAGAGIIRTDIQGRYSFVNQAFCDMLGYSEEELAGMSIWDLSDKDAQDKNRRLFEHLLQTGEGYQTEIRMARRNGSKIWVSIGASPMRDADGRVVGATTVIVDITRRKRAEESLLDGARRSLFLSSLSDTIRSIDSPSKIQVEAACLLGAHLKASRVAYVEVEPDGRFQVRDGYIEGVAEMDGWFFMADFLPGELLSRFQAGQAVAIQDVQNDSRLSAPQMAAHEALSIRAEILLPFIRREKLVAALLVQQSQPRAWREEEISLLEESAERMQTAIERAQAEGRMRDSEKRFRILANTVPSIVWTSTPEGHLLYVNDRWYDFTGLPRQENTPTWADIKLHPEDAPNFFQEMRSIKNMQAEAVVEVRLQRQDGVYHWFQTRSVPTLDDNGNITAWHGVLTDIHDRVEREEEQRKIINSTPFMLTRCSRDLRYQFVSRAYAEMIGMTPGQVIGTSIKDVMGEEGWKSIQPYVERVLRGEHVEFETQVSFKRFTTPFLHVAYTPDRDEQGNVVGWFASILDLTERRKAEEALRSSEERMRLAIESNRMVAWEWDPQKDRVSTSDNFSEVYGLSSVGTAAEGFALIWPEDLQAHREKVDQVMAAGGEYRSEFRITRPVDGQTIWLEERAIALVGDEGQVTRLMGIVIDITERKLAEQELAEFARQQEALYKLADELSSASSLEEMYNPALNAILRALQCERASILLFDSQDVMRFVAWRGLSAEYRKATDGHSPWTPGETNARPISMDDVATADLSDSLRATIQAEGIGALAFIPLTSRGRLIGKFMVYYDSPHTFQEAEVVLAQTIAHQLASQIERKRTEEELRQSRQRLSLTYHHAPIGIVETTLEGRFLEVNDELCRMLGYSYEDLVRLGIAEVTHKEDLERERELYQQLVSGSLPFYRMEKRFIRKDSSLFWGEVVRTMVRDEQGTALYGIGGILDINERKQKEEELRARTEEIEALMEVSPIGIFVALDRDCTRITGNPAGYRLVDMSEDSSANISKSAPEHERPTYRTLRNGVELKPEELPMQKAAHLGMEVEEETLELQFKSGIQKYIYAYAKPLFDAQGRVRGAIAAMLDITERRRNEQALLESQERFARFMQHFPGHAWIKDLQGRYVYANAAVFKTHNLSPEQLYGKTDQEVFPGEVAAQFVSTDEMALVEEKSIQMVQQSQQDNQAVSHALLTKFLIPGPDGRPAMIGGTALDITERVQMEEALRTARAQAETTAYRMTQLQKITAAISQAVTPVEIAQMVVEQGAPVLGAAASSIMLLNEETVSLEMIYSSADPSITSRFARVPLSMRVPSTDATLSGQPVWIASQREYLERYPDLAEQIRNWGFEAALAFPMVYQGRALGTLSLSFDRPTPFSPEDQEYLLTLARQAAQAFEQARIGRVLRLDAAMMENVPAGIYLVRASDGIIVHTNPQLDKLFGYEPGEIVGKPVSVLNGPNGQSPQEMANSIIIALNREGSWQGEVLSIRKDGSLFWCSASVTTFEHDVYGTVWVAARQDITARKQIEASLRESEQRYRAIVSQATAGIVRKDESGRLLFVNQAFCDMLGMPESELTGRPIWELTHEDDVGENKRLFDRLMVEGIPFQFEKRLIHRDGSILWVNVSVSPVIDSTGKTNSAVSVYVDITGRKQAEGRLALLTTVSELAREFEDPDELMFAVSKVVGEHFKAKRTLFDEVDLENDREVVHRDYHRGASSVAGVHKLSDYSSITTAKMLAGKTVVNRDSKLDPRTASDYTRSYALYGERAYVAVPLMREERWVASLWVSDDQPRNWEKEDIDLLEGIAERTWTAAEKLRVDRALRDSEERLRVTFDTTVVGFATLQPDMHFMEVNDAFCRIVGYSRDELLLIDYNSLVHPRFSEETRKLLAQLIAGEVPSFTIEKIFVRRDGTEIWVQNSLSLVRDSEGTPLHLIAICQDVTERKRAEEALHQLNLELEERVRKRTIELQVANEFLRESEATSRLILESMPDAIVIIDRDGQIVHANAQVEILFGYSPEEVLGLPVETLVPQRFRTQHEQQRTSYGEQRNRRIMGLGQELFGRRKDESDFPVEVMLAPIDNSTNWDVLVAIRDNTRQRQAQEALRSNEEKLRTLFDLLPVGVSFINKDGRVSELNSALAEILKMSKNEILSGNYKARRFIRADGSPMHPSEFASTRTRQEQKTIYNVETGIVTEDGEIIWTSVNAAPVQVADVEAVIVTIDMTERKKAEEALHKNRERLRLLSRRLVEVQEEERHAIARELHDRVGQNLAALTLNLNILRNQLSGEILDKVGTRLNDSVNLVKDILTITRSVMADLRPNVLDDYGLDAAINEYADRFTQRYGIRVITHTPAKPTPRLDPGIEMTLLRITQEALTNIAKHAQASQAVMTLEVEEEAVLITVEDNGQGILSWQKVNQPGSHGLRIMRERAEAFGGSLKINSTYKNGTKIEVKIPLASKVPGNGRKEKKS